MCGIAGLWSSSPPSPALLRQMGRQLLHRGPDDDGSWVDPDAGIGFAHQRLAIVDLTDAGHQPMQSSNGRYLLNFNGEIYNHAEIRANLDRIGATPAGGWRGHADTEALIEAIAVHGLRGALDLSVGQFAFALWDRQDRTLTLVRDRFGEKPLYYGWAGKDFVFASELKAIRCHPRFEAEVDRRALQLFTSRNYIPAPHSIYRGIYKLEPGCLLELGEAARRTPLSAPPRPGSTANGMSCSRYWSYRDVVRAGLDDPITDEADAIDELERALAKSVIGQSAADVPVGVFLSSGIDSSTIAALHQKYSSQRALTFTIGFEEAAFNEADGARAIARHIGTDHHEQIVTARDAQQLIPKIPEFYDEPFADSSQIPTYLVSRFARERVKVALSGDGSDELFGGYNRYVRTARLWSKLKRVPRPVRSFITTLGAAVPETIWNSMGGRFARGDIPPQFGAKVRKSLRTMATARNLEDLFAGAVDEWNDHGRSPVIGIAGRDSSVGRYDLDLGPNAPDAVRMMYCDVVTYLPDDILCKVDRASMAASLEARGPYLDHRVAALAARIPIHMKIRGGFGKQILRQVLYRQAPPALFERPKAGFGIPVGEWIRGPLRPWAEDLLDPRQLRAQGWFDPEAIATRWQQHLAGTRNSTPALWSILMFQAWLRDRDSVAAAAA